MEDESIPKIKETLSREEKGKEICEGKVKSLPRCLLEFEKWQH